MASTTASQIATAPDGEQGRLPDEILEDIFLRLDSGADLARASATCRAFRRVTTGHRFLRSFASLHPPPVVGFIDFEPIRGLEIREFNPAEPPHRSAPAARALAQAGDYRLSFLPNDSRPNTGWLVRDGRFLLSRDAGTDASSFLELVVCDPLHRRYVQIPPIPGDLVPLKLIQFSRPKKSEPFLAPAACDTELEEAQAAQHFRVIYNWLSNSSIITFAFSTVTGKWCFATSFSFFLARSMLLGDWLERYYARGCFYWVHPWEKHMLKLDPCEMKFSRILHGKGHQMGSPARKGRLAVVDAAEDRLGLLTLNSDTLTLYLYTNTCQSSGVEAEEWRHDKCIPLPEPGRNYFIIGTAERYLLLGVSQQVDRERSITQCFVLNLETLLVERLCVLDGGTHHGHPYASFPPPLSPPSL